MGCHISYSKSHASHFNFIHIIGNWISQCISKIKHILVLGSLSWSRLGGGWDGET